jgi:hypothetical protein
MNIKDDVDSMACHGCEMIWRREDQKWYTADELRKDRKKIKDVRERGKAETLARVALRLTDLITLGPPDDFRSKRSVPFRIGWKAALVTIRRHEIYNSFKKALAPFLSNPMKEWALSISIPVNEKGGLGESIRIQKIIESHFGEEASTSNFEMDRRDFQFYFSTRTEAEASGHVALSFLWREGANKGFVVRYSNLDYSGFWAWDQKAKKFTPRPDHEDAYLKEKALGDDACASCGKKEMTWDLERGWKVCSACGNYPLGEMIFDDEEEKDEGPYQYPCGLKVGERVVTLFGPRKYNTQIYVKPGEIATVEDPPNDDFPDDAVQVKLKSGCGALDASILMPLSIWMKKKVIIQTYCPHCQVIIAVEKPKDMEGIPPVCPHCYQTGLRPVDADTAWACPFCEYTRDGKAPPRCPSCGRHLRHGKGGVPKKVEGLPAGGPVEEKEATVIIDPKAETMVVTKVKEKREDGKIEKPIMKPEDLVKVPEPTDTDSLEVVCPNCQSLEFTIVGGKHKCKVCGMEGYPEAPPLDADDPLPEGAVRGTLPSMICGKCEKEMIPIADTVGGDPIGLVCSECGEPVDETPPVESLICEKHNLVYTTDRGCPQCEVEHKASPPEKPDSKPAPATPPAKKVKFEEDPNLACPSGYETATGHYDPAGPGAGIEEDGHPQCAGCGVPKSKHVPAFLVGYVAKERKGGEWTPADGQDVPQEILDSLGGDLPADAMPPVEIPPAGVIEVTLEEGVEADTLTCPVGSATTGHYDPGGEGEGRGPDGHPKCSGCGLSKGEHIRVKPFAEAIEIPADGSEVSLGDLLPGESVEVTIKDPTAHLPPGQHAEVGIGPEKVEPPDPDQLRGYDLQANPLACHSCGDLRRDRHVCSGCGRILCLECYGPKDRERCFVCASPGGKTQKAHQIEPGGPGSAPPSPGGGAPSPGPEDGQEGPSKGEKGREPRPGQEA